jgi:hypothetical protein
MCAGRSPQAVQDSSGTALLFQAAMGGGIYRWFSEVFETTGGGCWDVILYNIHGLTGVSVGPGAGWSAVGSIP